MPLQGSASLQAVLLTAGAPAYRRPQGTSAPLHGLPSLHEGAVGRRVPATHTLLATSLLVQVTELQLAPLERCARLRCLPGDFGALHGRPSLHDVPFRPRAGT
jgi:hypothetical protein